MYYVYIIYSEKFDRYYIGYSADIITRVKKHNLGATKSTKPYRPWKLVYSEKFSSKHDAIIREKEIKKQKSRVFIEKLKNTIRASRL